MNHQEKALQILRKGTVIPAIPLAITQDCRLDEARQRRLIRYYLASGAGGVAAAVHSTQFEIRVPHFNLLRPVLETVIEEIAQFEAKTNKTVVCISGVCGDTAQACAEAQLAKELGFDAVLLSPGGLNHCTEEELLVRTRAVAKIMPVVGFYLQEAVGGRVLSREYWREMSNIPNVVAIKCACFHRYRTQDLVKGVMESPRADEVALYTGNDDHIVFDLLTPFEYAGKKKFFVGGLLGQWSVWTRRSVELFERCQAARKSGQVDISLLTEGEHLTEINGAVFDAANDFRGCIPGLHYVLKQQGLMQGLWCLNPNEVVSPGQAEEIDRLREMYPEVIDDDFVRDFLLEDKGNISDEV